MTATDTSAEEPASWQPTEPSEDAFVYHPDASTRRPRGWERAPKSSHVARHKGRKVWKRSEAHSKELAHDSVDFGATSADAKWPRVLQDVSTNTPRPIKRLRLKDVQEDTSEREGPRQSRYFTTLQDGPIGTPKRKRTSRKSLKADQPLREDIVIGSSEPLENRFAVQEDTLQALHGSATAGVERLLSAETPADRTEIHCQPLNTSVKVIEEQDLATSPSASPLRDCIKKHEQPGLQGEMGIKPQFIDGRMDDAGLPPLSIQEPADSPTEPVESEKDLAPEYNDQNAISPVSSPSSVQAGLRHALLSKVAEASVPKINQSTELQSSHSPPKPVPYEDLVCRQAKIVTPRAKTPLRTCVSQKRKSIMTPISKSLIHGTGEADSPQIGATLLRRESLRRKESPQEILNTPKSKSTMKKQGLKKRDTLQEREILQDFNAAESPNHEDGGPGNIELEGAMNLASPAKLEETVEMSAAASPEQESVSQRLSLIGADESTSGPRALEGQVLEGNDLQRAVQTSPQCVDIPGQNQVTPDAREALNEASSCIANAEINRAMRTILAEKAELPNRKTRSSARFSDDTSLLKDFLNRAQAKKAAKEPDSLFDLPKPQTSPRRSPRKPAGSDFASAVSPEKPSEFVTRPGTPPSKSKLETLNAEEMEEINAEPTSCRRSTRTRLPAPFRTPPGVPSFIPVRRADGTDPVVLQKSQAQEIAIVTRANTRRNKGQSKPPVLALQDLPAETPSEVANIAGQRAKHAKSVGWAENLASYHKLMEVVQQSEEKRPRVKRMRGLGATNGTPAPKRAAAIVDTSSSTTTPAPKRATASVDTNTSNGTPAPKRRGKVRL